MTAQCFSYGHAIGHAAALAVKEQVEARDVDPQAIRLALPSLSNSLISLVKDTSLVSVIAVTELMLATKEVIATTFQPFPLYLTAAVIYWIISMLLEALQRAWEKRLARGYAAARI